MPGVPKIPEGEFIRLFPELGAAGLAERYGVGERSVRQRRRILELKHKIRIDAPDNPYYAEIEDHAQRMNLTVRDGTVLVGSDAHYWPGPVSTAHRAFVRFVREMRPAAIVLNGDVADFPKISRHPPIGWTHLPEVSEEIEAIRDRLDEIEKAKPVNAKLYWTLGNHDARFETKIATVAPEFARVHGTSLKDHFPHWQGCWSLWINGDGPDGVVVKHRFKGGIHAVRNNTLMAGRSIVTGHLHAPRVHCHTDYNGTRYGVDAGCLADVNGPQWEYTEDNAKDWRSGFCVLTFVDGKLLMPELALVWDEGVVQFRGELINVDEPRRRSGKKTS